jgi:PIN domain nuclease of toxin-antitoxin system
LIVLIDTCAYLIATHDSARLPGAARDALIDADLRLWSPASTWEIAVKASLGRLDLPAEAMRYLDAGLAALRAVELPIEHRHARGVFDLPWIHKDPFDRLLIAQALAEGAVIVTSDTMIPKYPGVTAIWR